MKKCGLFQFVTITLMLFTPVLAFSGVLRMESISSVSQPKVKTVANGARFLRVWSAGGGVVQQGIIEHIYLGLDQPEEVDIKSLSIINSGQPTYPFAVSFKGDAFTIELKIEHACPAANFVRSVNPILYTTTIHLGPDIAKELELVSVDEDETYPYVHKAFFHDKSLIDFLDELDFSDVDGSLADDELSSILQGSRTDSAQLDAEVDTLVGSLEDRSTYLNNDLHVNYLAFLHNDPDRGRVVDIAGQPLRYYWTTEDSKISITDVLRMEFENEESPNFEFTQFYQTLALLRSMYGSDSENYNTVVNLACDS